MILGNEHRYSSRPPQDQLYLNLHRQIDAPPTPRIGQSMAVDFYAEPGYGTVQHVGVGLLSFSLASTPLVAGAVGGKLFLDPASLFVLSPVVIPAPQGKGTNQLSIPANPALVGVTFYLQGVIASSGAGASAHFTNYTPCTIAP